MYLVCKIDDDHSLKVVEIIRDYRTLHEFIKKHRILFDNHDYFVMSAVLYDAHGMVKSV